MLLLKLIHNKSYPANIIVSFEPKNEESYQMLGPLHLQAMSDDSGFFDAARNTEALPNFCASHCNFLPVPAQSLNTVN